MDEVLGSERRTNKNTEQTGDVDKTHDGDQLRRRLPQKSSRAHYMREVAFKMETRGRE